jgi:hypothetical protein
MGVASSTQQQQWMPNQGRSNMESVMTATNGSAPSRTLWYAATGSASSVLDGGARAGPHVTIPIIDSGGAALRDAEKALYGRERLASQRIHWMFSPTKDERVASLLVWIDSMSHALATLGVSTGISPSGLLLTLHCLRCTSFFTLSSEGR